MAKKVERPVGPLVDPLPVGNVPDMRPLHGRWIRLDHVSAAKHAADLYASFDGKDPEGTIWTYLGYGPFASQEEFTEWVKAREAARDPWFYAFVRRDTGKAVGMGSFMRNDSCQWRYRNWPHLDVAGIAANPGSNRSHLPHDAPLL